MAKYYMFTLANGKKEMMSLQKASGINCAVIRKRLNIIRLNIRNRSRVRDGFQAGWAPNLGRYVGGRKEYDQICKDEGLIQHGNEEIDFSFEETHPAANSEFAKEIVQSGTEMSGRELEAIENGDYFDDDFNDE